MNLQNAQGVVLGFSAVVIVILLGYLASRFGITGESTERALNRVAFHVATPSLYFVLLATSDLGIVVSTFTAASLIPMVVCVILTVVLVLFTSKKRTLQRTTLLAGSAVYANTGNIGIPIAVSTFGDASFVAPIVLLQVLVLSPITLVILELSGGRDVSIWRTLVKPFQNSIIIASVAGLVVALVHIPVPDVIITPLDMLGDASIPILLLAFGMSVPGARPFARRKSRFAEIWIAVAMKIAVLPSVTVIVGVVLFGIRGEELLALAIIASLPSAQTIYNYATQYDVFVEESRDIVLITTVISIVTTVLFALFAG